jgi:ferredoxin
LVTPVAGRSVSVSVDRTRCIASGLCVSGLPEVFDQDDDQGIAFAKTERPAPSFAEQIRAAADLCPSQAITVHDGGEQGSSP